MPAATAVSTPLNLRRPFQKLLFAAVCLAIGVFYFKVIYLDYRAANLINDPVQLSRAVSLAPASAEYRGQLGRYLFFVQQNIPGAAEQYRRATELNPRAASAWLDLALAHKALAERAQESHALQRAVAADPRSPRVAWEAAQRYLALGETETALRHLQVVVGHDPSASPAAIDLAWQATHDPELMLRYAIPQTVDGRLAFLNYMVEQEQPAGAALAWNQVVNLKRRFSPGLALGYVEFLLTSKTPNAEAVVEVWRILQSLDPEFPALSGTNSIVNGGFEQPSINAGLDWRSDAVNGVNAAIHVRDAHSGSRSLAIVLAGAPLDDVGVFQYLALRPGTRYEFSAYVRNETLAGAGGLRFTIRDAQSNAAYYTSAQLPERDDWQLLRGSFQTPKDAGVAVLRLVRSPAGQRFRGKFWIDDLELIEK